MIHDYTDKTRYVSHQKEYDLTISEPNIDIPARWVTLHVPILDTCRSDKIDGITKFMPEQEYELYDLTIVEPNIRTGIPAGWGTLYAHILTKLANHI